MNKNASVLKFKKYIVENISYTNNNQYEDRSEGVPLDFDFDAEVYTNEDQNEMVVLLTSDIFRGAEKNNYPFEMNVALKGYFYLENVNEANLDRFKANAIAILFPYLRALVSTFSVNANVAPIILPPMNINAFLDEKKFSK